MSAEQASSSSSSSGEAGPSGGYEEIAVTDEGGARTIMLNRPHKYNAITYQVCGAHFCLTQFGWRECNFVLPLYSACTCTCKRILCNRLNFCNHVHVHVYIHVLMRDEKEGRKKQARSNSVYLGLWLCTAKAAVALIMYMYIHVHVLMRDEKDGRKKQAILFSPCILLCSSACTCTCKRILCTRLNFCNHVHTCTCTCIYMF